MVAENLNKREINICNIIEYKDEGNFETIKKVVGDLPGIKINLLQMCRNDLNKMTAKFFVDIDLLMITNLSSDDNVSLRCLIISSRQAFLFCKMYQNYI